MAATNSKFADLSEDQVIQSPESSAVKADAAAAVGRPAWQLDAIDKADELATKLQTLLSMAHR